MPPVQSHSMRRRVALLLLTTALLVALASLSADALDPCGVARGGAASRRAAVTPVDGDDEEDEEDEDDWDFFSDAAVVAAAEVNKKPVTCAMALDAEYINDDYCDCADGSDEPATGACALTTSSSSSSRAFFQCTSSASDGQQVASAFLRDGVCDCCDGSDEPAAVCPETCALRRADKLRGLRARLELVQDALRTSEAYARVASDRIETMNEEFQQVAERTAALQRAFQANQEALSAQVERTGVEPSQQQIYELRGMYQSLNQWQYRAYVHRKLIEPSTFASGYESFAALAGECFPFTVNEKQLKGGSSNVIPREYVVAFCPFQNVTQNEPGYAAWQRAERLSKLGRADDDEGEDETEATQPAIVMGVWDTWQPVDPVESFADTEAVALRQRFDHGEPCANGQERVVNVDVFCGATNQVLSVEEPEMCVYALAFETPAACSSQHEADVQKAIAVLEKAQENLEQDRKTSGHEEL